jgi:hypothetical protein
VGAKWQTQEQSGIIVVANLLIFHNNCIPAENAALAAALPVEPDKSIGAVGGR